MRRKIPGLNSAALPDTERLPDGFYLVRVARVQHRWEKQKPVYALQFEILEPGVLSGRTISAKLHATVKALWKLSWFLRDFGYDPELLGREELDERAIIGLRGVVKLSHTSWNGRTFQNLEAFTSEARWEELSEDAEAAVDSDHTAPGLPGFNSEVA